MEGRRIGRARLDVDHEQVVLDRRSGMSLTQVAKKHAISRATVCRLMKQAGDSDQPQGMLQEAFESTPVSELPTM